MERPNAQRWIVLFDLPPMESPIRGTATKRLQARCYWLTAANELAYSDSAAMTLLTARRWQVRIQRSDVLDIEWHDAGQLPEPPTWAKRIDRIPVVIHIERDQDLFDLMGEPK
jgi:hypothetical protein